ncbi:hypothetical protein J0910_10430 [Nocardiopsis sp. CNT-189]|uniref:hypothetical protein n=1 Tax=Nocardiopsis oceanisediminis TaxID=2816862 RepID=UPI003B30CD48
MAGLRNLWAAAPRRVRWAAAAAAAALLVVAVSVTAVLWAEGGGPSAEAGPDDLFRAAPECGEVPAGVLGEALGEAALDAAERGLLEDSDGAVCTWTSVGTGDGGLPPRVLRVDFRALFTDRSGEVSGAEAAGEALAALEPIQRGVSAVPALGEDARAWRSTPAGDSAEVAFRKDNLLVRVSYGGAEKAGGPPLGYRDARGAAIAAAEGVEAAI